MTLQADASYAKSPVELELFEKAAFAALRSYVPNYYRDGREDTFWGLLLRSISSQMARLDFKSHYNVYGADPSLLNPADIVRRFAGPLYLNRNYPGTTQYDLDLKAMILKLLDAYRLGATTTALQKVIEAFTGETYEVEELFKSIGTYYDVSDRHALRIGVKVAETQRGITTSTATDVARVRDLVTDLYDAIDLCKPAHVGINLTTVLGLDEDMGARITHITDEMRLIMLLEELEPGDPMLYQAPFRDKNTPDTGLAPAVLSLTYQWLRDGAPIAGANGPDYTLPATTLADTGAKISVKITDPLLGTFWSQQAVVTVTAVGAALPASTKPKAPAGTSTGTLVATLQPYSRSVHEGDPVAFAVAVQNATQPGLLSPHLNRVWEVVSDELHGLDLD